jgi:hypothetical protein
MFFCLTPVNIYKRSGWSPSVRPFISSRHCHLMAYCERCSRWFPHDRALGQHKEDSSFHWPCDDCDMDFASFGSREQHYVNSRRHHYCQECSQDFRLEESRRQHMLAKHHYCGVHDRVSHPHSHWTLVETHVACRFSIQEHSSNCTTNRAITVARSAG